jgi:hypothetical protein
MFQVQVTGLMGYIFDFPNAPRVCVCTYVCVCVCSKLLLKNVKVEFGLHVKYG